MQWKALNSLSLKKARKSKIVVFYDIFGIVNINWEPEGQTVNKEYYVETLATFHERINKKEATWIVKKVVDRDDYQQWFN